MKKITAILIALAITIAFAACSNNTASNNENASEATESTETTAQIVDENLLTVDITVPASMFSEESPATDELSQEQKDKGFKSAKLNDDGSVTYTMDKSAFKDYKEELKKSSEDSLNSLSNDYPCISNVGYNDNLSEIKISVNRSEYENGMNFLCITQAGFIANIYQAYTNETIKSEIKVIDKDTDEVIESATYPVEE